MPASVSLRPAPAHLVCETHDLQTQQRLLQRLEECLDAGLRDPEMLYLGGRLAASLGLEKRACRFLDLLEKLLCVGGKVPHAFFPAGLILAHILPSGPRRTTLLKNLTELVADAPRLSAVLNLLYPNDPQQGAAGSPGRILADLLEESRNGHDPLAAVVNTESRVVENSLKRVQHLASEASEAYIKGDLDGTRKLLERILLLDGNQPDVLRNLIVITSEQQDLEAYERYWRRYVKLLLTRLASGNEPMTAWNDLVRFYAKVATTTDREFNDLVAAKSMETLKTPGLLPRWLESHAALVWLDAGQRPVGSNGHDAAPPTSEHEALMHYWFRVFYPEFTAILATPTANSNGSSPWWQRPHPPTALPFCPALKLLTRFLEWSKFQFALSKDDAPSSAHLDAATALVGCAARIPVQPHALKLMALLEENELKPTKFRRAIGDALSPPMNTRIGYYFEKAGEKEEPDWKAILAIFDDSDLLHLLPAERRLFQAQVLCRVERAAEALDLAFQLIPKLDAKDFKPKSSASIYWANILQANLGVLFKLKPEERRAGLEKLKRRVLEIPDSDPTCELRTRLLAEFEETEIIFEYQDAMRQGKFQDAREWVEQLKDPKLREQLQRQIAEAEVESANAAVIRKQVDDVMAKIKECFGRKDLAGARREVSRLPNIPELDELRKDILQQIDQAQEHQRLDAVIDTTMNEIKDLVGRGNFYLARQKINGLPSIPELAELKRSLHGQINEAEEFSRVKVQLDALMPRLATLVQQRNFYQAREEINDLPDHPGDMREVKSSLLKQIDDAQYGR